MESSLLEENGNGEAQSNKILSTKLWEETKMISRVSVPSMVFRVMSFGVLLVTQSFVGHINTVDLAAYALVQSISYRFVYGILLGMSSATETLCGQAFGARQYHMMGVYLQRSWIINSVTTTILLPVMIFATPIYELLGEDDDISEASEAISVWFIPILYSFVFCMTIQMFVQAQMKNMVVMYLSIASFVLHLFISWIFVFELNLGIAGAMGALVISQWGVVFGQYVYVFGGWCKETWYGFSRLAFADLLPVIKLSIPAGFMICLELWYSSILVLIAGYSSDAIIEVSAFSICMNINQLEFMIALGLFSAACVRVSNELGRGSIDAAKYSIRVLLWMSAALGIFFFLIIIAFGRLIPYLFTSNEKVVEAAANLSVLLALTMLVTSFQAVFSGVAVGCGSQGKVAIVNAVSYYVIGIPIGCVLAFVFEVGVKGIWIGMLVGLVVQVLLLIVVTWQIDWNKELSKTSSRLGRFYRESTEE